MAKARGQKAYVEQIALLIGVSVLLALCVVSLLYLRNQRAEDELAQSKLDASADIEAAIERLDEYNGEKAELVTAAPDTTTQKAVLVFEGVSSADDMEQIITQLQENGMNATFFFSGLDALNNPDAVSLPLDEGFTIGNNGYSAGSKMESFSQKTVVAEICRAAVLIESVAGDQPTQLLFRQTTYSDEILSAAYACNVEQVVQPYCYVGQNTISSEEQAKELVDQLPRGSILCIRLSGTLSADEGATAAELLATAAQQATAGDAEASSGEANILAITKWIIDSLKQTDLDVISQTLVEQSGGAVEDSITDVNTTERAVAFTFSDLGSNSELVYLLNKLDFINATAVFFVTQQEMSDDAEQIRLILSRGQDLGISVQPTAAETGQDVTKEILLARETLATQFQYPNVALVRQSRGTPTDGLRAAAAATGCTLCQQAVLAVQDKDMSATDVDAIFGDLFEEDSPVLRMGEIVHFRMGVYSGGDTILGDLVEKIAKDQNIYAVRSLATILSDTKSVYTYPLSDDQILPELKDKIYPGQLERNVMNAIARRYIGTEWLTKSMLPGFSYDELQRLDRRGYIKNPDNAVFLTFDDWGTDANIMALLDVLDEYGVKATFFVRTSNVHYNPNLLRAIALAGHAIGCHTNNHVPLAVDERGTGVTFRSPNEEELAVLQQDLVESYDILQHIVGDVVVDGRPSLTLLFRPPTLAMSKEGLTTVLDCGFTFSVSGNLSTQDYDAPNVKKLAATIRSGLRPGAVIVMHMSDNSKYTAEALETVLAENSAKPEDEQVKFARLDTYLQDGYNFR